MSHHRVLYYDIYGEEYSMEEQKDNIKTSFSSELYSQFNWFKTTFEQPVQEACDEFFDPGFEFKMVGVSEDMNVLTQNESFFVTKVSLDPRNDIFIRISQNAIRVILDKVLGKSHKRFELSNISDLEAKIITTFNEYLYKKIEDKIDRSHLEKYPVTVNISYFVRNISTDESARFVLSFPKSVLHPENLPPVSEDKKINEMLFKSSPVDVKIKVGTTIFSVDDVKKLDVGDVVVFDNSNSREMTLIYDNIIQKFSINPNKEILLPIDNEVSNNSNGEDEDMDTSSITNLWDSLQIEMCAEFEKIKVSLGELKDIQEGLVVDISSVYNNSVSLKVGDQVVAKGELVIVNDRYGVKVSKVMADDVKAMISSPENIPTGGDTSEQHSEDGAQDPAQNNPDEFDYSDFDIEQ